MDTLGLDRLDRSVLDKHVAWDIGSADVARYLSKRFDATAVLAGYSLSADVLPFLAARLSVETLAKVRLIALLVPGIHADSATPIASKNCFSLGVEPSPTRWEHIVLSFDGREILGWRQASAGYTAVWATENTKVKTATVTVTAVGRTLRGTSKARVSTWPWTHSLNPYSTLPTAAM